MDSFATPRFPFEDHFVFPFIDREILSGEVLGMVFFSYDFFYILYCVLPLNVFFPSFFLYFFLHALFACANHVGLETRVWKVSGQASANGNDNTDSTSSWVPQGLHIRLPIWANWCVNVT